MTPGVIGVKLHPVPRALAEIDLQAVVVGICGGFHNARITKPRTLSEGIRLEEVDRVSCARSVKPEIAGARRECRPDKIANVRGGTSSARQCTGHCTCL